MKRKYMKKRGIRPPDLYEKIKKNQFSGLDSIRSADPDSESGSGCRRAK
jgi:hypothetical protein